MIRRFVALLAVAVAAVAVASPAQAKGSTKHRLIARYQCVPMSQDLYPANGYLVTNRYERHRGLYHVDGASLSMHQLAQYGGPLVLRFKCAR